MVRKHLDPPVRPYLTLEQITLREVMDWLREMRDAKTLSPQTQRHCLATLSRFWGWCVLWDHTDAAEPVPLGPDGDQAGRRSREAGDVRRTRASSRS